jgi:hypothetical protein
MSSNASINYTQTFNAEDIHEKGLRYHPRTVSLYCGYSPWKNRTLGFFGNTSYLKAEKGIATVAGGIQLTFDIQEQLIGDELGSIFASIRVSFGAGVRSGATENNLLLGFAKVFGVSKKFDIYAEFYGCKGAFWFNGRSTTKIFNVLRIGIQAEKYPETTTVVGPLLLGEFSFNRYASLRAGATLGAQVQSQTRFHWVFGFTITGVMNF